MAQPGDGELKVPTDTVRRAAHELDRLAHTAMDEVEASAKEAAPGGLLLAAGAGLALTAVSALAVSAGLALPLRGGRGPLVVGLVLLGAAAACAVAGVRTLPARPLARTREELRQDLAAAGESLR